MSFLLFACQREVGILTTTFSYASISFTFLGRVAVIIIFHCCVCEREIQSIIFVQ